MEEEVLLLKIHKALKEGKDNYTAIRGNWKLLSKRLPHIQYAVGVSGGKVICAYHLMSWEIVQDGPEKGRKRFTGKEVTQEVLKKFQNAEDKMYTKFGSGSAVAYIYLSELQ